MKNNKEKKTKLGEIIKHLRRYGSISDPVARNSYNTNRLSGYIHVLRGRGYVIDSVWCKGRDKFGANRYTKYILVSEPKGVN